MVIPSIPIGTKLGGRYELKEVVAKGGMGIVYRATDRVMRRQVAVKALLDLADNTGFQLFQKECEVLASMTHPNIIEIYDVGQFEEEGKARPYLVMPLLSGVTLDRLIRAPERLSVSRAIDICCQACRGLQAAHEKNLIHRDIKPSNIFVMEDDSVKIIDFGVAYRLETGRTMGRKGTLLYMAPEQIEMKPLSAASDVFSLGIVCYEALTHHRPFERQSENSVVEAILRYNPPPASDVIPEVDRTLAQAVHKAIAKEPWHRYQTAREFGETLQKAFRGEPIEMFNPLRIQRRLQRASETFERGDAQFASEILGELEAEGHLDTAIGQLRARVDQTILGKRVTGLLETARSRKEEGEYAAALQKLNEILQLDATHTEALGLKEQIETERTEREIEEHLQSALQYAAGYAFAQAREALQRAQQLSTRDIRAAQLLSELDRKEAEFGRARQEEEQLYRTAVDAGQRGDIGSALARLQRLLDPERRLADAAAMERAVVYQKLHDELQAQLEALQSAYAGAKRRLENGDLSAAVSLCAEQLKKYPSNAMFRALQLDIEERQRRAVSERIAETKRKLELEADLTKCISILQDAIEAFPGEQELEQLIGRTRDKQNLVASVVGRARGYEQQMQFEEALSQWETLKTIYDRYPDLKQEIDRVIRRRDQFLLSEARHRWVEQIDRELVIRNYPRAIDLLARALEEHTGDAELLQLEKLAKRGLAKIAEAEALLDQGRKHLEAGRFPEGLASLSQAYDADDRNPAIRAAFLSAMIERAHQTLEQDSPAAGQMLHKVLEMEPENAAAQDLLRRLQQARKPEPQATAKMQSEAAPPPEAPPRPIEKAARRPAPDFRKALRVAQDNWQRGISASRQAPKVWRWAAVASVLVLAVVGISRSARKPPHPPVSATQSATIEIATVPAGAAIWLNRQESGNTAAALHLSMRPAQVQVEARLPGYQTVRKALDLKAGATERMNLVLVPVVVLRVNLPADGDVAIDGGEAEHLTEGQLSKEIPAGKHSAKIRMGRRGVMTFSFEVTPDGAAAVNDPQMQEVSGLLISNFGAQTRIYTGGASPVKVGLDGHPVGQVDAKGLELPKMVAGSHEVELGVGANTKKKAIEIGPERTLTALIDADPNTGNLMVLTSEDNATVVIMADGKERARGQTRGRQYRKMGLLPKTYTITAAAEGFDAVQPEQHIEIRKGEDSTVSFDFRRKALPASARIRLTPGSELSIDGVPQGTVTEDAKTFDKLGAATHTFRAQKARFLPISKTVTLVNGQATDVDLRLTTSAPIPVEFRKNPANSTVTYIRKGDPAIHSVIGTNLELPEGDYTFTANADGFLPASATLQLTWDYRVPINLTQTPNKSSTPPSPLTMAKWPPGSWTPQDSYLIHKAAGLILYTEPLRTASIQFAIHLGAAKGHAQWVLQYLNNKNYLLCDLDREGFQVTRIAEGSGAEVLTRKKAVSKRDWYQIRIELTADHIIHQLTAENGAFELLDNLPRSTATEGRFGFNILPTQPLSLTNFSGFLNR